MKEEKWLLAFRYPDMPSANEPYETCRDLIGGLDIDASVYRIQVRGVAHVVVLGEGPLLSPVRDMFQRSCRDGEPVDLPSEVVQALFERRRTSKIPGVFWERRSL